MKDDQLINKKYHILQRNKILKNEDQFIYRQIANRLNDSMDGINFSLKNCLEIGYSSSIISNYILSRFKFIEYLTIDISKEIIKKIKSYKCISVDHDKLELGEKKFDLIISNLYLQNTNDLKLLIRKIKESLNNNGFFIISLPGINCGKEIKEAMIMADIELYGGAYRRFPDFFSIEKISDLLKINNFKIPVIELDTIQLRYKKFSSLLNDIRFMGNSNARYDRKKKFEKKNYFNKVEEIYWKKFSNKNELILQFEIVYISCWK